MVEQRFAPRKQTLSVQAGLKKGENPTCIRDLQTEFHQPSPLCLGLLRLLVLPRFYFFTSGFPYWTSPDSRLTGF